MLGEEGAVLCDAVEDAEERALQLRRPLHLRDWLRVKAQAPTAPTPPVGASRRAWMVGPSNSSWAMAVAAASAIATLDSSARRRRAAELRHVSITTAPAIPSSTAPPSTPTTTFAHSGNPSGGVSHVGAPFRRCCPSGQGSHSSVPAAGCAA